ncbi:hypothetical protein ACHAPU_009666 [Fusarium lateritium]
MSLVVVGLFLPQQVVDDVTPPTGRDQFDVNRDPVISKVPGAKYLVRPLTQKRSTLFVLLDKNGEGLSRMVANPAGKEPCTVVFEEFMANSQSTQKNKLLDIARAAMSRFCEEYMRQEHGDEFANTNTSNAALAENGESIWKNHSHPAVRLRIDLQNSLDLYMESG